ncbi:MAG: hypothetical protein JJU11_16170, partial [Candidatus Sumerlaeia bacterium]|nr:hypothetical protein [Candidatus Sumerlaeia bacterium]
MKKNSKISALRRKFLPASAVIALALSAGMAQATVTPVSSTSQEGVTPTETDNDFTRIQNAIDNAPAGQTIALQGEFDLTSGFALDSYMDLSNPGIEIVGKEGLTLTANTSASITFPYGHDGFYINDSDNLTITNLTLEGATYGFYIQATGGTTSENMTITNNHIRVRHDGNVDPNLWFTFGIYIRPSGSNSLKNMVISENQFDLVLHPDLVARLNTSGIFTNIYCVYMHNGSPFGDANDDGFQLIDNDIDVVLEGEVDSTEFTNISTSSQNLRFFRDNSNSDSSNMDISGNTMNGGVMFSDDVFSNFGRGISPASKSGEYQETDTGSRIRFNNNTFINVTNPYTAWRGNAALDEELVYVLENNVFIDSGNAAEDVAVVRAVGGGAYSDGAPHGFHFNLDTQVINGGNTITGIELLHYMSDPANVFFDNSPGDPPGQFGILNAEVIPPADPGDIVNNPDWTGLPKFSDPTGGGTLAMGYNAFGDEIDPGDPNRFVGLSDNEEYELTEDESFPVGTVVRANQTLTIRSEAAKSDRFVITPNNQSVTTSMFVLEDETSTLILEDVVVSGNVPGLFGNRDSLSPFTGNGGTIVLDNVKLRDFNDVVLSAIDGTSITATNVEIREAFRALRLRNTASSLTFTDGLIEDVARLALFSGNGGTFEFTRNRVGAISGMFAVELPGTPGSATIGGSPSDGNMFMHPITVFIDGVGSQTGTPAGYWNMSHNWHSNVYGPDSSNDGYIDGDVSADVTGAQSIEDGVRFFGSRGGNDILETNIVATFDRDNDGLPDVIEFRLGTDFQAVSSGPNDVPDGVMVAAGLDPLSSDLPPGWDGDSFTADTNSSGYVDWYEALMADLGLTASLGDLTNNGQVELGDAVRALQVVNGALPIFVIPNPNNLNVDGTNPNSQANPLQIQRIQAVVRNTYHAHNDINK